MNRLLTYATALSLAIVPAFAIAQTPPHKGGGGGKPPAHHTGTPHATPHAAPHGHGPAHPHGTPHAGGPGRGHGPAAHARPVYGHGVYHGPRGNRFYYNGRYFGRIHGRPWAWPSGYGYHRFYAGGILPAIFLGSAYVYADYLALGLAAPEPGFVWVRYGPDLVLVNQATGQIVNVAYGVFL